MYLSPDKLEWCHVYTHVLYVTTHDCSVILWWIHILNSNSHIHKCHKVTLFYSPLTRAGSNVKDKCRKSLFSSKLLSKFTSAGHSKLHWLLYLATVAPSLHSSLLYIHTATHIYTWDVLLSTWPQDVEVRSHARGQLDIFPASSVN